MWVNRQFCLRKNLYNLIGLVIVCYGGMVMSGLELLTNIFGVGGVKTIEKALAAKGITFAEDVLPQALSRALSKFDRQTEGLSASFINAERTFGLTGGYAGSPTRMSPLKPYFERSNRGEPIIPTPDKIAEEITWMLSCAASCSNPKAVKAVGETASKEASKLALAA